MEPNQSELVAPKNLICNFRARTLEDWQSWQEYKQWCQENGRDICHLTISLTSSFFKGVKTAQELRSPEKVINLQMNNTFTYAVQRPRREPFSLGCIKSEYRRCFSSILFESYVLEKARGINGEFCFRDFLEMDDRAFHRIIRRLIRKGKIMANPQRSVPRMYFLTEKLADYEPKKFLRNGV